MDYMKQLLIKEKVKLEKNEEKLIELYVMLGNQQELKNVAKKAVLMTEGLTGEVSLVQFDGKKHHLTAWVGNREKVEGHLDNKKLIKKVRETKKPYFKAVADEKSEDYFIILPLLAKEECVGVFCIHEEQEIINWKEINTVVHFMSVAFKYYNFIEINKNIDIKDVVTGLFNYRHFQDQLEIEIEKSERYTAPLSLLLIDIDSFKLINDKLGNDVGDMVLRQLGEWIEKTVRKVDMPARLDADTFAILLSNTEIMGAEALLQRILIKINNNPIKVDNKEFYIKVKSSILGYEKNTSKEEFINKAKEGLTNNK